MTCYYYMGDYTEHYRNDMEHYREKSVKLSQQFGDMYMRDYERVVQDCESSLNIYGSL